VNDNPLLAEMERVAEQRWHEWDGDESQPGPPVGKLVAVWSSEHGLILLGELRRQHEEYRRRAARRAKIALLMMLVSIVGFISYALGSWQFCFLAGVALFVCLALFWILEGGKKRER
jgi:hypothetical protein